MEQNGPGKDFHQNESREKVVLKMQNKSIMQMCIGKVHLYGHSLLMAPFSLYKINTALSIFVHITNTHLFPDMFIVHN